MLQTTLEKNAIPLKANRMNILQARRIWNIMLELKLQFTTVGSKAQSLFPSVISILKNTLLNKFLNGNEDINCTLRQHSKEGDA